MSRHQRLTASLTRDQSLDLLARMTQIVDEQQLPRYKALDRAIQEYEANNRPIPSRDKEKLVRNVDLYQNRQVNPQTMQSLRNFHQDHGLPGYQPHQTTRVDVEQASTAAEAFERLQTTADPSDPNYVALKRSYAALRLWIDRQWQMMLKAGIKVIPHDDPHTEPYRNSTEMMRDVRDNKQLKVYQGGNQQTKHPFFSPQDNFKFRAVHDWLAHTSGGHQFGPQGEQNAWQVHLQSLPPIAHDALTMETALQNWWVNYGPHIMQNPEQYVDPKSRPFFDQPPTRTLDRMPQPNTRPVVLRD